MSTDNQNVPTDQAQGDIWEGFYDWDNSTQFGIGAAILGAPLVLAAVEALGWGEIGFAVAALAAGGIGVTGKKLISRQMEKNGGAESPLMHKLKNANWKALFVETQQAVQTENDQVQGDQGQEVAQPAQNEQARQAPGEPAIEDTDIFAQQVKSTEVPGVARITVDQMVRNVARNSYEVYIGRSLTGQGNKAVKINFFKRHIKLIGASQHGKSSMAAALMEAIMRTHDPEKVMFALLDLENKTSRLFADADHIAELLIGDKYIPLHAKTPEQVLQHLEYVLKLVQYRYDLSELEIDELPLVIVYLEEFIELKDFFKQAIDQAQNKEQEELAKKQYERLLHCIRKIARMGLKVHVQLFMCAQVDYANDDLKEALANITSGMAFCVKPSAARAAGFMQEKLMARNAQEDQIGQCVVEMPECKDLILAPHYPLRDKLKALGRSVLYSPVPSPSELTRRSQEAVKVNTENAVNALEKRVNASENEGEHSPIAENVLPGYTQSEEVQVLLAWAELQRSDKPMTRTALMEHLGWNRKTHYSRIIKPVCDKHHILVAE
jgi:FtsK/SpoIIIE family